MQAVVGAKLSDIKSQSNVNPQANNSDGPAPKGPPQLGWKGIRNPVVRTVFIKGAKTAAERSGK